MRGQALPLRWPCTLRAGWIGVAGWHPRHRYRRHHQLDSDGSSMSVVMLAVVAGVLVELRALATRLPQQARRHRATTRRVTSLT